MARREHSLPKGTTRPPNPVPMEGGPGAGDATSGGGAGSGTPDADMNMRTAGRYSEGDVKRDREKLFPETAHRRPPGPGRGSAGPSRKNPRATPRSHRRHKGK